MNKPLDFIVIGAQKSGTTSLYNYLAAHPGVFVPSMKEIDFFLDDVKYAKGDDWYLESWFKDSGDCLRGDVSAKYILYEKSLRRIFEHNSEIKLIAILRNPIERAYSHYMMAHRHSRVENESFEKLIMELVDKGGQMENQMDSWTDFLAFGKYGAPLSRYLQHFPRERIKVVFMEDMGNDVRAFMRDIFEFIGADRDFYSEHFEKKHLVGGKGKYPLLMKFANSISDIVQKNGVSKALFGAPPLARLKSFIFWAITKKNTGSRESNMGEDIRQTLKGYYAEDVAMLEREFDLKTPWTDFR